jgi:integrase
MNSVDAIYDGEGQLMMLATLTKAKPMMGAIFLLGVASGLRIGDLLALRVVDLGPRMVVVERKTGKTKRFELEAGHLEFLTEYADGRPPDAKLFPTTRTTVYRWFRRIASDLGIEGDIGTHTMRKTHLWNIFVLSGGDIERVRLAANHRWHSTTISYLQKGIARLIARFTHENASGRIEPSGWGVKD